MKPLESKLYYNLYKYKIKKIISKNKLVYRRFFANYWVSWDIMSDSSILEFLGSHILTILINKPSGLIILLNSFNYNY